MGGSVTEESSITDLIKDIKDNNPRITDSLFQTVNWVIMGRYMHTMSAQKVAHVIKLVHG